MGLVVSLNHNMMSARGCLTSRGNLSDDMHGIRMMSHLFRIIALMLMIF